MKLWPFKRPERRNYTSSILAALEAAASTQAGYCGRYGGCGGCERITRTYHD